jgi:hypothetical protein
VDNQRGAKRELRWWLRPKYPITSAYPCCRRYHGPLIGYLFAGATIGAWPGSIAGSVRGSLIDRPPRGSGVALFLACLPPNTAASRGSRAVCPARSSAALLASHNPKPGNENTVGTRDHRHGSARESRHHRDHRRAGMSPAHRPGSAPTTLAISRAGCGSGAHRAYLGSRRLPGHRPATDHGVRFAQ